MSSDLRLAILDSDSGFVRVLVKRASDLGWQHRHLEAAPRAEEFVAMRVNALVVDLTLLGPRAWEFLEQVAATVPGLGIVVCTGRSSVSQRVRGLRLGADDWVTKPCHPEEVLARVEAVVRRRKQASARVDVRPARGRRARDQGRPVPGLRPRLERRPHPARVRGAASCSRQAKGKVLQREEIYQAVWGWAMAHGDRSVDVFIRKVRLKLEKASPGWNYIHTHFGVGYRFDPERPGDAEPDLLEARAAELDQDAPEEARESRVDEDLRARGRARLRGPPRRGSVARFPVAILRRRDVPQSAHRADRRGAGRRRRRVRDREPGRRRRRRAGRADDAHADADRDGDRTEAETEAEPAPPPEPAVTRIRIKGGQVVGGAKRIEASTGDTVRIVVASDAPDELHLHGYDITVNSAPGQPARFQFKANLEGVFELESHVAEDAGRNPLVAQLVVQPS